MALFAEEESVCQNKTQGECVKKDDDIIENDYVLSASNFSKVKSMKSSTNLERHSDGTLWFVRHRIDGIYKYEEFSTDAIIRSVVASKIHNYLDPENALEMRFVIKRCKRTGKFYISASALQVPGDSKFRENEYQGKPYNMDLFYAISLYLGLPRKPNEELLGFGEGGTRVRRTDYFRAFENPVSEFDLWNEDCLRNDHGRVRSIDCSREIVKEEFEKIKEKRSQIFDLLGACREILNSLGIDKAFYPFFDIKKFIKQHK